MTRLRFILDNTLLHLLAIILVTIAFYAGTVNNFFFADDFIWLSRVKHLPDNWSSIFTIENRYFTPLTYISFFANYRLSGLNPYWYHLFDLILHASNGILLYLLTCRISGSRLTALIAATLFTTSSSILITVLWSSARTDLIMVFFSLATMIAFVRGGKALPVALYVLSLCAKGTALAIPVVLFLLTYRTEPVRSRVKNVAPYIVINVLYVSLLLLINSFGSRVIPSERIFSLTNYVRSLPSLIVPERHLAATGTPLLLLLSIIILAVMLGIFTRYDDMTARTGIALTIFGLLPLVFTRDYVLAGNSAAAMHLLNSPSNRLYLACIGISLLYAVLFEKLTHNRFLPVRVISVIVPLSLVCMNYFETGLIEKKWAKGTSNVSYSISTLNRNASMLTDNSVLLLYNFEGSSGFLTAMINSLYDLKNVKVHGLHRINVDELTNIDRSPFNKSQYEVGAANVKLIMSCNGYYFSDMLTRGGNQALQRILADYRELYATAIPAEELATRNRLEGSMSELRTRLKECTM